MNETDEKWYSIPGFPNYEVSSAYRSRNKEGKIKRCTPCGYKLWRGSKQYVIRPERLLYAALHGVDPMELKKILVIDVKGELTLMTQADFFAHIKSRKRNPEGDKGKAIEFYKNCIGFAQKAISYYKTGDISEIAEELSGCEERIKMYIRSRYSTNDETVNEAWHAIMTDVLCRIGEGATCILTPEPYLRKVVKTFFAVMRERKKIEGTRLEWIGERFHP